MTWREARLLRSGISNDKVLDALERELPIGETIALVASANFGDDEFNIQTRDIEAVVTNKRLLGVKGKMFGGVKYVVSYNLLDIPSFGSGLYNNTGPGFAAVFRVPTGAVLFHFNDPDAAEALTAFVNLHTVVARQELD